MIDVSRELKQPACLRLLCCFDQLRRPPQPLPFFGRHHSLRQRETSTLSGQLMEQKVPMMRATPVSICVWVLEAEGLGVAGMEEYM